MGDSTRAKVDIPKAIRRRRAKTDREMAKGPADPPGMIMKRNLATIIDEADNVLVRIHNRGQDFREGARARLIAGSRGEHM